MTHFNICLVLAAANHLIRWMINDDYFLNTPYRNLPPIILAAWFMVDLLIMYVISLVLLTPITVMELMHGK